LGSKNEANKANEAKRERGRPGERKLDYVGKGQRKRKRKK
jgi:hypothetical protein